MVTAGGQETSNDKRRLQNSSGPLYASCAIPNPFPIPPWDFRTKYSARFEQWWRGVKQLANAFDISEDRIFEDPPLLTDTFVVTRQTGEQAQAAAVEKHRLQLLEWQTINTALYWHVLPSLIFSGIYREHDLALADAMVKGAKAHGRGLIKLAYQYSDMSSVRDQTDIQNAIFNSRIQDNATIIQLLEFTQWLYKRWLLLTTSNPAAPLSFYQALLTAMPTNKQSGIIMMRYWLAGEIHSFGAGTSTTLATYANAFAAIESQAETYGIPRGDTIKSNRLNLLADRPDGTFNAIGLEVCNECTGPCVNGVCRDGGCTERESLALITGRSRRPPQSARRPTVIPSGSSNGRNPRPGTHHESAVNAQRMNVDNNECDFCESYACKSRKYGGSERCICRHTSTFDITKISRGAQRFAKMARAYHRNNPTVTTLKGKRFKVANAPSTSQHNRESVSTITLEDFVDDSKIDTVEKWLTEFDTHVFSLLDAFHE